MELKIKRKQNRKRKIKRREKGKTCMGPIWFCRPTRPHLCATQLWKTTPTLRAHRAAAPWCSLSWMPTWWPHDSAVHLARAPVSLPLGPTRHPSPAVVVSHLLVSSATAIDSPHDVDSSWPHKSAARTSLYLLSVSHIILVLEGHHRRPPQKSEGSSGSVVV
jgi:hypothetical protein